MQHFFLFFLSFMGSCALFSSFFNLFVGSSDFFFSFLTFMGSCAIFSFFYFIHGIVLTLLLFFYHSWGHVLFFPFLFHSWDSSDPFSFFSIIHGVMCSFFLFLIHSWVFMGSCALFSFLLNSKPSTRTLGPRIASGRGSRSQTRPPPPIKSTRIVSAAPVQQESAHAVPTSPRACAPAPNREMQQKGGGERCNTDLLLKHP
jgi:hypothetical protein